MIFPIINILDLTHAAKTIPMPDNTNVKIHKVEAFWNTIFGTQSNKEIIIVLTAKAFTILTIPYFNGLHKFLLKYIFIAEAISFSLSPNYENFYLYKRQAPNHMNS